MSTLSDFNLIEKLRPRGAAMWRWIMSRRRHPPGYEEDPGPTTPVRRRPSVDFSLTGLVYCSMMLFMGLAAINSQANLLFGVFGLMIGILLVSAMICRLVLRRVKIERVFPEYVSVGQPATIQYNFLNSKRFWPSVSIVLAELDGSEAFTLQPHAYMLHAGPGKSASVPISVTPKRRGLQKLSTYQISTSFPFGFVKRASTDRTDDSILIYPAIGVVGSRLLAKCQSAERGGANMKPRRNGTDEFYGVKEFRWGENPRWIYWKRSARTGELVSREMVQISPPRLLIIVDSFIETPTQSQFTSVEKVIAMAASLASRGMDSGMAVGLCAWAGDWVSLAPQRGKRNCRDVLAALAKLPVNRVAPGQMMMDHCQGLIGEGITPVLFTPRTIQPSLPGRSNSLVVVSAESPEAQSWFQFDPKVNFSRSMPIDQINEPLRG